MTKNLIKLLIWSVVIFLIGALIFGIQFTLFATKNTAANNYTFEVKKGMNMRDVATLLEDEGIINSQSGVIFQNLFNPIDNLQVGQFTLKIPASPEEIVNQISIENKKIISANKQKSTNVKEVLIKEGLSAENTVTVLSESLGLKKQDFINYIQPYNANLKSKFSFLPPNLGCVYGNIQNCAKYYLEGYLYPDTYSFKTNVKIEEVVEILLSNFEKKVIKNNNFQSDKYSLQQIITLSSLVEKETGRPIEGVNKNNIDQLNRERKSVAEVFLNRVSKNMKLGSDPTIGYWANKTVCQQTLTIENCLSINDPETNHILNTYKITGLPIAPIASPQEAVISSILKAVNEPEGRDYLFFVSDKWGNKYFGQNFSEHEANIAKVKQLNLNDKSPQS